MQLSIKCDGCGTDLTYQSGTKNLVCSYCNHQLKIADADAANEANRELNLEEYLQNYAQQNPPVERRVIRCKSCGAQTELAEHQQAGNCPFCATAYVFSQAESTRLIKPQGLLPFHITQQQAAASVQVWLRGLWFAPSKLKRQATQLDKMRGIYLPFWTYDCATATRYRGERGERYSETVMEKDAQGNPVARAVSKIRWHSASGVFESDFDDVLIPASKSLPEDLLSSLEPWDLTALVDYQDNYLAGYITESYQVDLKTGYQQAQGIIDDRLRAEVRQRIGGDEQRISSIDTHYLNASFKHILLPVWVSAYRFGDQSYQLIVNARTGAVQGKRPWSWVKIASLVVGICGAIALGIFLAGHGGGSAPLNP